MKTKAVTHLLLGLIIFAGLLGSLQPAQAAPQACTPTAVHTGWITTDETWCLSTGSIHTVSDYVAIQAGVTVTIEPGITVKADNHFYVDGDLQAVGTVVQPIIFTSEFDSAPDEWYGLEFRGGTGHLGFATVRYSTEYAILVTNVQSGELLIENSQILDSGLHGIFITNSHVTITDTTFSGTGANEYGYPVYISDPGSLVTLNNNTFNDNYLDRVYITFDAMTGQDITLAPQTGLEGYMFDYWVIPSGIRLTVEPGVKLMANSRLFVDGDLQAIGTAAQPIIFTSIPDSGPGEWWGLMFRGGSGHLSHAIVRYGGDNNIYAENIQTGELLIEDSQIVDGGSVGGQRDDGIYIQNSHVIVRRTDLNNLSTFGYAVAVEGELSNVALEECRILHSYGGLYVHTADQVTLRNVVFSDLQSYGLVVRNNGTLTGEHVTLSHIAAEALFVYELNSSAALTNSIITLNGTGARTDEYSSATLDTVLLTQNTEATIGQVTEINPINGASGLMADGYHLTRYSAAIGQANSTVTLDIDGDARPLPAGTQADLGADEYVFHPLEVFDAEATAFDPQWVFTTDPITGDPVSELHQDYLLRYFYGSPDVNPPALDVSIEDNLPDGFSYLSDTHSPEMDFTQTGSLLTWEVISAVQKGDSGEIILRTTGVPTAGQTLTNNVTITAGATTYSFQISTIAPVATPILLSPGIGEYCPPIDGAVTLHGFTQPNVEIRVYENSTQVNTQTVTTGEFTLSYNSTHAGIDPETLLEVRTCTLQGDQQCSEPTSIILKAPQSFWCPQESVWEGTPTVGPLAGQHLIYGFRNEDGEFSSQDWVIPGVYGFWDTDLTLATGLCPGSIVPPTSVWVIADGILYEPQPGGGPVYHFDITGTAHTVTIASNCDESYGVILIDPDGYVFDSTQGFDPENPTQHVLPGATVTAYEYVPSTESWRPWPAHLYNDQVNPQIVGENGYFAFFTPPGQYYLQVDAPAGYQSWRSPMVEVVNEIVHVNVPLTPLQALAAQQILVASSGLSLPEVTIQVGQSVMWIADDSWLAPDLYIRFSENPIQHILSELNPLENVLGFDSGRMVPGQVYVHRFSQLGTFTYTDGYGHTGLVTVEPYRVLLPLVLGSSNK